MIRLPSENKYGEYEDEDKILEVPLPPAWIETESGSLTKSHTAQEKYRFSQYFDTIEGFLPTTDTIKSLPSGLYNVIKDSNQNKVLEKQIVKIDDLIIMPDTKSVEIINEIRKFWTLENKFKEAGFNYKRGILLYGPPGSGKTATINIIVQQFLELVKGIVLMTSDPPLLSSIIQKIRTIEPERPIIIIFEDIDAVLKSEENKASILALLDGEKQISKIVFLATTNYPEALDPNIVNRPSRFDMVVKIDAPDSVCRKIYLSKKLPANYDIDKWVADTEGLSIAHIKEFVVSVVCLLYSYEAGLAKVREMSNIPKSSTGSTIGMKPS